MSDWNKVSGNNAEQWKPENAGDEVSGVYTEVRDITTKLGPVKVYTLRQADGSEVAVFGKAQIDRNMAKVAVGDEVRIVYLGLEKNPKTGFNFKNFDIFSRKATGNTAPKTEEVGPSEESDDMPF